MTFHRSVLATALFAGLVFSASSQAATNFVTNGDFTPGGAGAYTTVNSGNTFAGGAWTVTSGSIDWIGSLWQAPPSGGYSVDLDGYYAAGAIQQFLNLSAGTYLLSFYLSGNPDGPDVPQNVNVQVSNHDETFLAQKGNSYGDMNYQFKSFQFTTLGPTTLTFASTDAVDSAFGPVIGGVSVTAVPEPETYAMMLAGLGALGFMARRRKAG